MKLQSLRLLLFLAFSTFLFSACSSGQYYTFSGSKTAYQPEYAAKQKLAPEDRYARANEFAPQENPIYASTEQTNPEIKPVADLKETETIKKK